jgi:hypothetical protein
MATTVITTKNPVITRVVEEVREHKTFISSPTRLSIINDTLPYRIRLTNIQIPGHDINNIPGIGIQIIGFSNYIL